jgi:hypothetical protein
MANSTKPNLTAVTTPALSDLLSVRQSGDTRDKKETLTQVRAIMNGDLGIGAVAGGVLPLSSAGGNIIAIQPVAGIDALRLGTVGSGVNYATINPSATGANVPFGVGGTDATIGISIVPKNNGKILFNTTGLLQIGGTSSAFPAFKAQTNSGVVNLRVADDSADAIMTLLLVDGRNGSGTVTARLHGGALSNKGAVVLNANGQLIFLNTSDVLTGTPDVGFGRAAAGVVQPTNGGSGFGQIRFNGSTGAGIPMTGANCPATTLTAPYQWALAQASDGTPCVFALYAL